MHTRCLATIELQGEMELQGEIELCRGTGITISGLCGYLAYGILFRVVSFRKSLRKVSDDRHNSETYVSWTNWDRDTFHSTETPSRETGDAQSTTLF